MTKARRAWTSFIVCLSFIFVLVPSISAAAASSPAAASANTAPQVSDIEGHWANSTITKWINEGWITGYEDGSFKPNSPITRAEFVALINRAFGYSEKAAELPFTDLPASHWAYYDIAIAYQAGYFHGANSKANPDLKTTRQEGAVLLANVLRLDPAASSDLTKYKDGSLAAGWAQGALAELSNKAIFKGDTNNKLRPLDVLTRAEAVTVLEAAKAQAATVFDQPGEYGSSDAIQTIEGDVIISSPGVTLNNMVIKGNLLIAGSVGEGDVYLKKVTVKGATTVQGGGSHSVHFEDSIMLTVIVDKKNGTVRIVANGSTAIQEVVVQSSARIEADGASSRNINTVTMASVLPEGSRVDLVGSFDSVNVAAKSIVIDLPKGSVDHFNVDKTAENTQLNVSKEASIISLILNAAASVLGSGDIGSAVVNAASVSFEQKPKEIVKGNDISEDTSIAIGDKQQSVKEATSSAPDSPSIIVTPGPSPDTSTGPSTGTDTPGGTDEPDPITMLFYDGYVWNTDGTFTFNSGNWILLSEEFTAVEKNKDDGNWYATAGGTKYKVEIINQTTGQPLSVLSSYIYEWDHHFLNVDLEKISIQNSITLSIKLIPAEGSGKTTISREQIAPYYPATLVAYDFDRTPGLDGRDFQVYWLPSAAPEAVAQSVYIVPQAAYNTDNFNIRNTTPVLTTTDRSVRAFTGTENTVDSLGNPFVAGTEYSILVSNHSIDGHFDVSNSLVFTPVSDDPYIQSSSSNKPNTMVLPSGEKPVLTAGTDAAYTRWDWDDALDNGSSVYAKSSMDGFIYLVPERALGGIGRNVTALELSVDAGQAIRLEAKANEQVVFNTAWLPAGRYYVIALSPTNQTDQGALSSVAILAADTKPLSVMYLSVNSSVNSSTVSFSFTKKNLASNVADLKSAVTLIGADNQEHALAAGDTVAIEGNKVIVTLGSTVFNEYDDEVKLAGGSVKDSQGNVVTYELKIGKVPRPIEITAVSSPPFVAGQDITFTVNQAATVYLMPASITYSSKADLENAVVAKQGYRVDAAAGVESRISTTDLPPGTYLLIPWGGRGVEIQLQQP